MAKEFPYWASLNGIFCEGGGAEGWGLEEIHTLAVKAETLSFFPAVFLAPQKCLVPNRCQINAWWVNEWIGVILTNISWSSFPVKVSFLFWCRSSVLAFYFSDMIDQVVPYIVEDTVRYEEFCTAHPWPSLSGWDEAMIHLWVTIQESR